MSQQQTFGTGGGTPPLTQVQFVTQDGTVTSVGGIINVVGGSSVIDDPNGIRVIANPDGSNNEVIELTNRAIDTVTTTDVTPTTIYSLPMPTDPGLYSIQGYFGGFIPATVDGGSYFFDSSLKTDGTTATEIGTNYTTTLEDMAMANADINVTTSGNNVIFEVIGVAATTINWIIKFEFSKVS